MNNPQRSRRRRRASQPPRELTPCPEPVVIEGVAEGGKGVARLDGKTLFVDGALRGETVKIAVTRRHARYDEAVVTEVMEPSTHRQSPPCAFFEQCGGCSLQYQDSAGQIADKESILIDQLERIGRVTPVEVVKPLTGAAMGYRGKARLGVRYVKSKQRVLVGFREKKHRGIAEMDTCAVLDNRVSALIKPLAAVIEALSVREQVPQIEVATDADTVVLVFRHLAALSDNDRIILREFGDSHRVRVMLQPAGIDSIHPLPPDSAAPLSYQLPDEQLKIEFYPHQFVQVNAAMNRSMIAQAMDWLDLSPDERVADLFCGVGNFTLPLARRGSRVVGIEGEQDLVNQARANAELNGFDNVEFRCHDLFDEWGQASANPLGRFDKIVLDPPRTGAQRLCENIEEFQARRIVYISCNPATLARDAGVLVGQKGYRLERVGVIDMFPHTSHVESMALFEQVK